MDKKNVSNAPTENQLAEAELQNLKESVLQELEQGGENMTLEKHAKRERSPFWFKVLLFGGLFLVIYLLLRVSPATTPEDTLTTFKEALLDKNVEKMEAVVDINSVAEGVVTQLHMPAVIEQEEETSLNIQESQTALRDKFMSFIQPELAERLADELRTAIAAGKVDNAQVNGLLPWLWEQVGGDKGLSISKFDSVQVEGDVANAVVMVTRNGWKEPLPLNVKLVRQSDKTWQAKELSNVASFIEKAQMRAVEKQVDVSALTPADLAGKVVIKRLEKLASLTDFGVGRGILITMAVENKSPLDIEAFSAEITFADAAGQELYVANLVQEGAVIPAAETLEKTWTVIIDPQNSREKHVYNLPQESMKITPRFVEIKFAGDKLYEAE